MQYQLIYNYIVEIKDFCCLVIIIEIITNGLDYDIKFVLGAWNAMGLEPIRLWHMEGLNWS